MKKSMILQRLDELQQLEHIRNNPIYLGEIEHFRNRLQDNSFKIAVVGEFSSGKSTFINAILQKDLLKHAKEETTACITYLINIPKNEPPKCTVFFHNGKTQTLENFEGMTEFSTAMSTSLKVSNEVKYVELRLPLPFWDEKSALILVDTPGLNGMYDKHRELTIDEVQNAHACIYLLQLRGIADSDVAFIKRLTRYQTRFLFVLNFIDDLHAEEGETPESRIANVRSDLETLIFNDLGSEYRFDVCGVSSLKALTFSDKTIKRLYSKDTEDITEKRRSELLKESRFDDFHKLAKDIFSTDAYDHIKTVSVISALTVLLTQAKNDALLWLDRTKELKGMKGDSRQRELLAIQKEHFEQSKEKKRTAINNFIDSEHSDIRRSLEDDLRVQFEKLCENLKASVAAEKDYDEFKRKIEQKDYNNAVRDGVYELDQKHRDDRTACLQNLLENALIRVRESCEWKENTEESAKVTLKIGDLRKEDDMPVNVDIVNQISTLDRDLADSESKKKKAEAERIRAEAALNETQSKQINVQQRAAEITREERESLARLGSRPASVTKYGEETHCEKRTGFWGSIAQFFVGDKIVTRTVSFQDDSAGQRWDAEEYRIKQDVREKKERANRQKADIEREIRAVEALRDEVASEADSHARKIARLKRQKEEMEAYYREWEKKARGELFRERKKDLQKRIESCIMGEGGVLQSRMDSVEKTLKENIKIIKNETKREFEQGYEKQLKSLNSVLVEETEELQKPVKMWQTTVDTYERLLYELAG